MIAVHRVYGLVGALHREHFAVEPRPGLTARQIVDDFKDPAWGEPLAAILDGRVIRGAELETTPIADGADVVVLPDPEGIGEILVWIAVNILIPAVVSIGIAFAYAKLVGKPKVAEERGGNEESPTYAWDGIKTGYGSGFRIPVVYGSHRVGGQVVSATVYDIGNFQDVLGLFMILSAGPISRVAGIDLATFPERNGLGGLFNPNPNPALALQGIRVNGNEITDQKDINVSLRAGTLRQTPVPRWPDVATIYDTLFELRANQFQTYSTVGDQVSSVRIRIRFQGLFKQSGNAATNFSAKFGYSFRKVGLNFSIEQTVTATAARRSRFNWSFMIQLPGPGAWELRIRRLTPDDKNDTLSASSWTHTIEQFGAGNGQQIRYVNLAIMAIELRATERVQGSAPTVTVPVEGRLVDWWTTASGWQGETFFDGPSARWIGRNPAWEVVDFMTSAAYGLGRWITRADIVLPQFEDWGGWNDELVPDGMSGTHPRNHCDIVVDQGAAAWEVVMQMCRTGQAVPILVGRQIGLKFEHPDSVAHPRLRSQVFTQSNMLDFAMSWTDVRNRPNIIDAQILDEANDWEQTMVSVEDPDAFGLNTPWILNAEKIRRNTVQLFGVTRKQQARRLVFFMHATARLWKAAVTFEAPADAVAVEVGDVIGVETDVVRFFDTPTAGLRAAIAGASTSVIKLDQTVTISSIPSEFAIWQTDGTVSLHRIVAPTIGTWPPGQIFVFIGGVISWNKGAVVAFGVENKTVRDFVVTAISITEDIRREVEALQYDEAAFDLPPALMLDDDPGEGVQQPFDRPLESVDLENLRLDLFEHGTRAIVAWERPPDSRGTIARLYLRHQRLKGAIMLEDRLFDEWLPVWQGLGDQAELLGLEPGETYELVVTIANREGASQSPEEASPSAVIFTAVEFPDISPLPAHIRWAAERAVGFELAWNDARHDSTRRYEIRQGTIWDGAFTVARTAAERVWLKEAPYGPGQTYQVRTIAESGLPSELEIRETVNVGVPTCKILNSSQEW